MRVLDLFSGIGGFSLGLERAGMRTVAFCEIEPFPRAVLAKHWPHVPCYHDIHDVTADRLDRDGIHDIGIVTGGYPCQPFSHAGKQRGHEDPRHLWPQMRRVIGEVRPAWVLAENVAGHITLGLDQVLADLEADGYAGRALVIPAAAVDAPHIRQRIWIVARDRDRESACAVNAKAQGLPGNMADTDSERLERWQRGSVQERAGERATGESGSLPDPDSEPARRVTESRQERREWEPEPGVGRVANGIPRRMDRLRALGNSVVPQVVEVIGRAILEAERQ